MGELLQSKTMAELGIILKESNFNVSDFKLYLFLRKLVNVWEKTFMAKIINNMLIINGFNIPYIDFYVAIVQFKIEI